MIQPILIGIALLATLGGGSYFAPYDFPPFEHDALLCQVFPSSRLCAGFNLGAVSFPTSLDVFENPGATASVATTVTHSTHHANENDAIEALEAKVGINSSTPVTDSIFAGTSVGGSKWTTFATTTSSRATNFSATGSSTLQNFTFANATGTSATTTNFFSTNASSTNLYGISINGFSLTTCQTNNVLTWASGIFGCEADDTGGSTIVSTTTTANMSSTTVAVAAFDNIRFKILIPEIYGAGDVSTSTATIDLHFNSVSSGTNYGWTISSNAGAFSGTNDTNHIRLNPNASTVATGKYITGEFLNVTSQAKVGTWTALTYATSTGQSPFGNVPANPYDGRFVFSSGNARVTTFEVGTSIPGTFMATGTTIIIEASN